MNTHAGRLVFQGYCGVVLILEPVYYAVLLSQLSTDWRTMTWPQRAAMLERLSVRVERMVHACTSGSTMQGYAAAWQRLGAPRGTMFVFALFVLSLMIWDRRRV